MKSFMSRVSWELRMFMAAVTLATFIAVPLTVALFACAEVGAFVRDHKGTIQDVAEAACVLFGTEHPDELRAMATDAVDDPQGMAIPIICALPTIVDIFVPGVERELRMAEQRAGITSGGEALTPPDAGASGAPSAPAEALAPPDGGCASP